MSRVLVADDDADLRALVEMAVRRSGHEVVASVADGRAALEQALALQPALAILDVAMPGLTGLEVCARLRADPSTTGMHILLLTAAVHESAVEAGVAAGADAYVTKPFGVRALGESVRALLAGPPA